MLNPLVKTNPVADKKKIQIIHALLANMDMMAQKAAMVNGISCGRAESTKDLTDEEADALITHLKNLEPRHKMRRKIIRLAHEMHWHLPGTKKIDMERVNGWCQQFGYGHKPLNDYSNSELPKLVTQFEQGPYKHYLSNL